MSPRVSLFGVIHIDRPSKVADELSWYAEGADAVFIEWPGSRPGLRTVGTVAVSHPLLSLGGYAYSLLNVPVYLPVSRRYRSAERVAADRLDCPVYDVDRHFVEVVADLGFRWTVAQWAVLLALLVVAPVAAATTVVALSVAGTALVAARRRVEPVTAPLGTLLCVGLLATVLYVGVAGMATLAVALVGFVAVIGRTIEARNAHMLDRVEDICREDGHEDVVFVTGKGHLAGVAARARRRGFAVERAHASRWLRGGIVAVGAESARGEEDAGADRPDAAASLPRRVSAGAIDLASLLVFAWAVLAPAPVGFGDVWAIAAVLVSLSVIYCAALEATLGWTPGKQLLGLRVTDAAGRPATPRAALLRNLVRPVDAALCFALLGTEDGRLGDRLAGTEVRRL